MSKDLVFHADNILEAIANINADLEGHDLNSFRVDRRARQLVERNLEILSEASRNLPDEFKECEPEIPWREVAGIGNVLRHGYHNISANIVWEIYRKDLEPLRAAVERIREMLQ